MAETGKVYLVGAGPGDEGLLTLKGERVLRRAEVVVYDRLVSERILAKAPVCAELIDVGKNAGSHPVPQQEINSILLQKARENKLVVRLKGGDPFLFGRGGEELELLSQNGVPFEVVPGVTSAIAAAAYAGIPVTHRDFCSSLHIITGHAQKSGRLALDYNALVKLGGTLVFMMSVASVGELMAGLLSAGMAEEMPAAVVENGTLSNQRKLLGTVGDMAEIVCKNNVISPAVIIVGAVCALSESFDFFQNLPLRGCKILVTRPAPVSGKLSEILQENGAEVVECPCIETHSSAFDLKLRDVDVVIFTSAVGVESFFEQLQRDGLDSRKLHGKIIAAVGAATAEELLKHGIHADFLPSVFDGGALARELVSAGIVTGGARVSLFRAKTAGGELPAILRGAGAAVSDIAVYETTARKAFIKNGLPQCDYVTFTSASCVDGFIKAFPKADYSGINAVCIGRQTAAAAIAAGMTASISGAATLPSMVEKIKELYR